MNRLQWRSICSKWVRIDTLHWSFSDEHFTLLFTASASFTHPGRASLPSCFRFRCSSTDQSTSSPAAYNNLTNTISTSTWVKVVRLPCCIHVYTVYTSVGGRRDLRDHRTQARKSAGKRFTLDFEPMRKDTRSLKQDQSVAPQNGP